MKNIITTVTITDDFGAPGDATTIKFQAFGRDYEIDLNKRNAETFERRIQALYAPYIEHARDITETERDTARQIRAWAAQNGIELSNRGRIPFEIIDQYNAAHPAKAVNQ